MVSKDRNRKCHHPNGTAVRTKFYLHAALEMPGASGEKQQLEPLRATYSPSLILIESPRLAQGLLSLPFPLPRPPPLPQFSMLNRRAPRSGGDAFESAPNSSNMEKKNDALLLPPPKTIPDSKIPILPKKKRRRRKVPGARGSSGGTAWRAWIPLCFVVVYVLIVLASLTLLIKYMWKRNETKQQQSAIEIATTINGLTVGSNDKMEDMKNDPSILPYPKIIRPTDNNNNKYPQLSPDALKMCTNALWHTLETTTIVLPDKETFIHTGDIDDLWLRDSAAQIHPLLVPLFGPNRNHSLIQLDPKLDRIVSGLIRRTSTYIRHDPYANAFRIDDSYVFSEAQKKMGRHDLISTWNYELDSFCFWIRMVYFYWKQSPNGNRPNSVVRLQKVQDAAMIMVDVWRAEQKHELEGDASIPKGPLLDCKNCGKPYRYPGLPRNGKGSPTNASSGLTWTGFRPSDDECQYGYLVPANMFAVVALDYVEELAKGIWKNTELASKATTLKKEIQQGIEDHAIVNHPKHGKMYAYEVDGLGNSLLMDDANIPSLLSIPYLGYKYFDPEIYANTKKFIFSEDNPYYQHGDNPLTGPVEGYGSPHMEKAIRRNIWPMSLAMRGLTR